uniref:Cytochrome b6-f complex subunit VII n=1 Tax=Neotessella volvocina TaxID=52559 RepID=A0A3G2R020_9STRA|nr:cytochrome b6-f complex subunit VII [Neotessella volvocina]AYO28775.1 cytochrome b6-f complex subunit VII [Neotessella volvocina]
MGEIVSVAISCFVITIVGLALGFAFLQIQANS